MPTTTVELVEYQQGAIGLCCPKCRGEHLHHGRVTVFHRIEDDEMITQTVVTGLSATVGLFRICGRLIRAYNAIVSRLSFGVSFAPGSKS